MFAEKMSTCLSELGFRSSSTSSWQGLISNTNPCSLNESISLCYNVDHTAKCFPCLRFSHFLLHLLRRLAE